MLFRPFGDKEGLLSSFEAVAQKREEEEEWTVFFARSYLFFPPSGKEGKVIEIGLVDRPNF